MWFLCKFGLHGILCDDMGLGKTLQTLCIIGRDNERNYQNYNFQNNDLKETPFITVPLI